MWRRGLKKKEGGVKNNISAIEPQRRHYEALQGEAILKISRKVRLGLEYLNSLPKEGLDSR